MFIWEEVFSTFTIPNLGPNARERIMELFENGTNSGQKNRSSTRLSS